MQNMLIFLFLTSVLAADASKDRLKIYRNKRTSNLVTRKMQATVPDGGLCPTMIPPSPLPPNDSTCWQWWTPPSDGVLLSGAPKPPSGCDYQPCQNAVCACDDYCCNVAWDLSCRGYFVDAEDGIENNYFVPGCSAKLLCCEPESAFPDPPIGGAMPPNAIAVEIITSIETSFQCTPGTAGCCETMIPPSFLPPDDSTCWQWWEPPANGVTVPGSPPPSKGCNYKPCQDAVCACDSYCCETAWDLSCRGYEGAQGDSTENNYFVDNCSAKILCCEPESAYPDPPIGGATAPFTAPTSNTVEIDTSFQCTAGTKDCCDTLIPPSLTPPNDSTCWLWWTPPADGVLTPDMPKPPKGCDYSPCQNAVCACDSYCCDSAWDESCRGYEGAQGDSTENNYFVDNCSAKMLCCEPETGVPKPPVGGGTMEITVGKIEAETSGGSVEIGVGKIEIDASISGGGSTEIVVGGATIDTETSFQCAPGSPGCCETLIPPSYFPPADSTCWLWWTPPANGEVTSDMPQPPKGCDYKPCQDAVCACDSYCCDSAWDESCRGYEGAQGDSTENNYFVDNCSAKMLCCEDEITVPIPKITPIDVPTISRVPISIVIFPTQVATPTINIIEVPVSAPIAIKVIEVPIDGPATVKKVPVPVPVVQVIKPVPVPVPLPPKIIPVPVPVPLPPKIIPVPVPFTQPVPKVVPVPVPVTAKIIPVPVAKVVPVPKPVPIIIPVKTEYVPVAVPIPGPVETIIKTEIETVSVNVPVAVPVPSPIEVKYVQVPIPGPGEIIVKTEIENMPVGVPIGVPVAVPIVETVNVNVPVAVPVPSPIEVQYVQVPVPGPGETIVKTEVETMPVGVPIGVPVAVPIVETVNVNVPIAVPVPSPIGVKYVQVPVPGPVETIVKTEVEYVPVPVVETIIKPQVEYVPVSVPVPSPVQIQYVPIPSPIYVPEPVVIKYIPIDPVIVPAPSSTNIGINVEANEKIVETKSKPNKVTINIPVTETTTKKKKKVKAQSNNSCKCPPLSTSGATSVTNVFTTTQTGSGKSKSGKGKAGKRGRNLSSKSSTSYSYNESSTTASASTGYFFLSEGCTCPCICPASAQESIYRYVSSETYSGKSGKSGKSKKSRRKLAPQNACICNNAAVSSNTVYVSSNTYSKGKSGKSGKSGKRRRLLD